VGVSIVAMAGCMMVNTSTVHGQAKKKAAVAVAPAGTATVAPASPVEDNTQFFTQKVRPILAQSCYQCHTKEAAGGLRLDSRAALLKGGDSGLAVVLGNPDKSLLIEDATKDRQASGR
jgi:uncharacterized membrane protein